MYEHHDDSSERGGPGRRTRLERPALMTRNALFVLYALALLRA